MRKKSIRMMEAPAISDAEWAVMRVLWGREGATANEVSMELEEVRSWKPKTVQTLLRRLVDKGVVAYEKRGREFVFRPVVAERETQLAESRSFLEKVFGGGALAPLVAAFVEREELTAEEIGELRRILDGQGEEGGQ
jgi:BlaI family penicillinase repressor